MEIIFQKPIMLLFLLVIPLLILLHYYFFQHAKKRAIKFSNFAAMKRVTGTNLLTRNNPQLIVRCTALTLMVLASCMPIIWYDAKVNTADYVIAIDTSASMTSDDVLPTRLDVAKQAANAFISKQKSSTEVGIVAFSGVSIIKVPLTDDLATVKNAVGDLSAQLSGGTDIGNAMITSANLFAKSSKARSIILISDGSDTSGTLVEDSAETALYYLKSSQVKVNTILVGQGGLKSAYVENVNLPSIIDSSSLKKIADETGGYFVQVRSTSEIAAAFDRIEENSEIGKVSLELSGLLFMISFAILFYEWVILNTRFRALP